MLLQFKLFQYLIFVSHRCCSGNKCLPFKPFWKFLEGPETVRSFAVWKRISDNLYMPTYLIKVKETFPGLLRLEIATLFFLQLFVSKTCYMFLLTCALNSKFTVEKREFRLKSLLQVRDLFALLWLDWGSPQWLRSWPWSWSQAGRLWVHVRRELLQ